jgi:hypothetical protein
MVQVVGQVPERQVNPSVHGVQQVVARMHDDPHGL